MSERLSLTRTFLLWLFRYPPFTPYVNVSCSVDFSAARSYLTALNADTSLTRVSIQHLITASLARVYQDFPSANAAVVGDRILRFPHVGAVIPVDLDRSDAGALELGMVLVERAEQLTLRELAAVSRKRVHAERRGGDRHPVIRGAIGLGERLPRSLIRGVLDAVETSLRVPSLASRLHRAFPATVVISNLGSILPLPGGGLTRAASFSLPNRLVGLGSALAIMPLQDEVIALDGEPAVRPMLPIAYIFDHRLFDGVVAGKILTRLCSIVADPAATFGPAGER